MACGAAKSVVEADAIAAVVVPARKSRRVRRWGKRCSFIFMLNTFVGIVAVSIKSECRMVSILNWLARGWVNRRNLSARNGARASCPQRFHQAERCPQTSIDTQRDD